VDQYGSTRPPAFRLKGPFASRPGRGSVAKKIRILGYTQKKFRWKKSVGLVWTVLRRKGWLRSLVEVTDARAL
jgi:hypothetical protein